MSFQNYENFPQQGQQGDNGAGPGGPPQQDQNMGGQMPPNSAGGFQGGNGGDPGSAGGQSQGGDAKTTLWYDPLLLLSSFGCSVGWQLHQAFSCTFIEKSFLSASTQRMLNVVQDGRT